MRLEREREGASGKTNDGEKQKHGVKDAIFFKESKKF
jgi:hypothetical protein